jgi:hypothetical protein
MATINHWSKYPVQVARGGTGLQTITQDGVILGNGTGNLQTLALSKGELIAGDGATDPVALSVGDDCRKILTVDSAQASGLKYAVDGSDLLEFANISNVASFTNSCSMDSTYKMYEIRLYNLVGATDAAQLQVQFSEAGGALLTSSNYFWASKGGDADGESQSQGNLFGDSFSLSNASNEASFSRILVYNPSNSAINPMISAESSYWTSVATSTARFTWTVVSYDTAAAIDKLKFFMSSGNITSAVFELYGVP